MDHSTRTHSGHSNDGRVDKTSSSPLTRTWTAPSVNVLNDANNISIHNSSFSPTIHLHTPSYPSAASCLDPLYRSVVPNAILNAGGRADEVGCYPGTREEVIGLVERSVNAQGYTGPRMLWLSGPAGAGKSAIMQTMAERLEQQGVPQANFFFFRTDSSRSDASTFVATLMHQIIKLYPSVGAAVAAALASDPLIFRTGLHTQFNTLLHQIFPGVEDSSCSLRPVALLIDGLDECDSESKTAQRQILQALDALLLQKGEYFRVVIASRVEPQISMAFRQLRSQIDSIFLDDQYSPEKDIRLFVTAEFNKIKTTHHLASTLDPDWPSASDVDGIVSKSSGQFIYAATVMRFIANSSASPVLSLHKVQGIIPPKKNTPFAQLDAVYSYILAQVDDLEAVKAIFAVVFLRKTHIADVIYALELYMPRLSGPLIDSCISELNPLINRKRHYLEFFHASFPDFLKDKTRAGAYHVDLETFCTSVVPSWWADRGSRMETVYGITTRAFEHIQMPTPRITAALMEPNPFVHETIQRYAPSRKTPRDFISDLHRIYACHDPRSFSKIRQMWLADDPNLATLFPEEPLPSITLERVPHIPPVSTQELSIYERGMRSVGKGLHHVIGKGKTRK